MFPLTFGKIHIMPFSFHTQQFYAWAESILQSTAPVLAVSIPPGLTAAPQWYLLSWMKSSTFAATVCFSCSFKIKIISVDITLFQTKIQGVFTWTHKPSIKPQKLLGAYLHLAGLHSSGEIRRQFKIHRPPRVNMQCLKEALADLSKATWKEMASICQELRLSSCPVCRTASSMVNRNSKPSKGCRGAPENVFSLARKNLQTPRFSFDGNLKSGVTKTPVLRQTPPLHTQWTFLRTCRTLSDCFL